MSETPRSAAAQAGFVDEQMLERDMVAAPVEAETVTACCAVWRAYVESVEAALDPETVERLVRRPLRNTSASPRSRLYRARLMLETAIALIPLATEIALVLAAFVVCVVAVGFLGLMLGGALR